MNGLIILIKYLCRGLGDLPNLSKWWYQYQYYRCGSGGLRQRRASISGYHLQIAHDIDRVNDL
jgi:hypothetical protein